MDVCFICRTVDKLPLFLVQLVKHCLVVMGVTGYCQATGLGVKTYRRSTVTVYQKSTLLRRGSVSRGTRCDCGECVLIHLGTC